MNDLVKILRQPGYTKRSATASDEIERLEQQLAESQAREAKATPAKPAAKNAKKIEITPEERINAALDSVLRASGSALKNYTTQLTLDRMREAMRKVMADSYIAGSNDTFKSMKKSGRNA